MVYAVVRAGGRQEKVEVGSIITVNRLSGNDDTVELPAVLHVDGDKVTSDASVLAKVKVTAEVLEDLRGPKIVIQRYKNKTGSKSRQGHRQDLTRLKVTGIKLFSAGDFGEARDREEIVLRDASRGLYRRVVLKDNRIIGVVMYGDTGDGPWFLDLLKPAIGNMPISDVDPQMMLAMGAP